MSSAAGRMLCAAVLCGALVLVPSGAALAQAAPTPSSTPSSTPLSTPTTRPLTTRPPAPVPTTARHDPPPARSSPPPPPTAPPATTVPTIPAHPSGERSALGLEQTHAAQAELATLTITQRALLRELQRVRDDLAVRRFALVALAREVAVARQRLDEARAAEQLARSKVEETLAQLRRVEQEIENLAATAYRNHAGSTTLGALANLDVETADQIARARTYARSDFAFLATRVDTLRALERRLEAEQRAAATARAEAEFRASDLDARLAEQTLAFTDASDASTRAQGAVARSLGADATLIAQMVNPQFGADDITGALRFVQAGQPEPPTRDGIFMLPIPGAALNSPYGLRIDPIAGTVGSHPGVDFEADARTPIRAAAAGMVIMAGDCGGYGNCVVIDHGTSLATIYGHQSQVQVRVGDPVVAGQTIGLVGSTGYSTGPHLHFEVRLRGAPIDPVPTLTA